MLHVLLLILKIIGILLAVILGLLVLLVCVVLFVPVRYEVSGSFPGSPKDASARGNASWLLHLIAVQAGYEKGQFQWKARAAWLTFGGEEKEESSADPTPEGTPRGSQSDPTPEHESSETPADSMPEDAPHEPQADPTPEHESSEPSADTTTEGTPRESQADSMPEEGPREIPADTAPEEKKGVSPASAEKGVKKEERPPRRRRFSLRARLKSLAEKIRGFFRNIKYTFRKICDKIEMISEKKEQISAFIEDPNHRGAFSRVKKETVWIKRFLRPKKLEGDLRFGFSDPYRTGQTLAVLSMVYPLTGDHIRIQPDFEERVLEGSLHVKGKLRMIHMAMLALGLLLDKSVRRTYRDVRALLG